MLGPGKTTLLMSNEELLGLLLKDVTKTIENEQKIWEIDFLVCS